MEKKEMIKKVRQEIDKQLAIIATKELLEDEYKALQQKLKTESPTVGQDPWLYWVCNNEKHKVSPGFYAEFQVWDKKNRETRASLPREASYRRTGVDLVDIGGWNFSRITMLYCLLAYLRGRQHVKRTRVPGADGNNYCATGVCQTVDVTPEMYEKLIEKIKEEVLGEPELLKVPGIIS